MTNGAKNKMSKIILPTCVQTIEQAFLLDLGTKTKVAIPAFEIMCENLILLDRKQQDYGPRNISSFGLLGVTIRMNDKMERLKSLLGTKRRKPQNESIQDSFRDISNYGVIATMLSRGVWPND